MINQHKHQILLDNMQSSSLNKLLSLFLVKP